MRFRPCIDIHDGKVKQIVGGSLSDALGAVENYVSDKDAAYYAKMYAADNLSGGHIILLNSASSPFYERDAAEAEAALKAARGMFAVGGGITPENAQRFLDAGASHVIVTSYIFRDGKVDWDRLEKIAGVTGREHLILDLSCRKRVADDAWVIVTDRWQKYTDTVLNDENARRLAGMCDEFLIHAADVEGKQNGPQLQVVDIISSFGKYFTDTEDDQSNRITYAGGIRSLDDVEDIRIRGKERIDVTVGSALDLFGGQLPYKKLLRYLHNY